MLHGGRMSRLSPMVGHDLLDSWLSARCNADATSRQCAPRWRCRTYARVWRKGRPNATVLCDQAQYYLQFCGRVRLSKQ